MALPSPEVDDDEAAPSARAEATPTLVPSEPRTVFLAGLFTLALLATLYAAREIVWPITLAFVLKLMLQPAVRGIERTGLPRVVSVFAVVALLALVASAIGVLVFDSINAFVAELGAALPRLRDEIRVLLHPLRRLEDVVQSATAGAAPPPGAHEGAIGQDIVSFTVATLQSTATGLFTTVLLLFFFLLSGDTFLRRLVEILPRFSDKRQLVEIVQQVERDITAYLGTVTMMNIAIGTATALATWASGLGNPVLWGVIAFLLNFVPVLGPFVGVGIFLGAGLLVFGTELAALVPATLYLVLHLIEGEAVTPLLLARRFTLNPALVMLSLIFWYWMWGVPGGILAIPLLAIAKIVCDRVEALAPLGHFLGGEPPRN